MNDDHNVIRYISFMAPNLEALAWKIGSNRTQATTTLIIRSQQQLGEKRLQLYKGFFLPLSAQWVNMNNKDSHFIFTRDLLAPIYHK